MIKLTCILLTMYSSSLLALNFKTSTEMLHYVKRFLPPAPVILEAGGCKGEDTQNMKNVWPNAIMHVFEPLPSSFEALTKNTCHLKDVNRYQYALTSYSGTTKFYVDVDNNAASSIGEPVEFNRHEFNPNPIEVNCFTLDEWAKQHNVTHIDFMWLDMESHELYMFKHALTILPTVKAIYTEISYTYIRKNSCLYPDVKLFLEQQGFVEVWKSNYGRFGDALFIKKELV